MSNTIKQTWHLFKNQPDIWFFYAFLLTSTLSIRKVLYFFPINNSFNEYTGVYIYLSDILLFLTFISFILYNNKILLSNIRVLSAKLFDNLKMFHVEHFVKSEFSNYEKISKNGSYLPYNNVPRGTLLYKNWTLLLIKKSYTQIVNNYLIIFPLFLAIFSFISISWSINQQVALFRSVKLLEFILLYFYIILKCSTWNIFEKLTTNNIPQLANINVPRPPRRMFQSSGMFHVEHSYWGGTFLKNTFLIIIATGFIQAIMGITQFIIQYSIGLFWLKESIISPSTPGVAKIILDSHTYIRAYGLFPHPNILGGFLIFSITITILYNKMFHVEHFKEKQHYDTNTKDKCSTWNIYARLINNNVPRGTFITIILSIQILTLILTFSKSAIFGLLAGLFYIFYSSNNKNVPRGTLLKRMLYIKKLILIGGIIILLFTIIRSNMYSFFLKSLQERELYLNVSRGTFLSHPFIGVGSGQFIANMAKNYSLEYWQYQPVHNVFLLILNEFGIFMILGFLCFIYKMFHVEHFQIEEDTNVPRGTFSNYEIYLKGILVAFIFIMFFDHYFWDIQQGQILLWLLFGLIIGLNKIKTPK